MNPIVTEFLAELKHSFSPQIEELRKIILSSVDGVEENIKWNGPNYNYKGEDRITVRLHPGSTFQVIFHAGAKVKEQPKSRLLNKDYGLLAWKSNDRAVLTIKATGDFNNARGHLPEIVKLWLGA